MNLSKAPMGWNSWDCYGASVDEETVRKNADFMAKHLKQYGWEYIVVDIQWSAPNASSHEYEPFADLCMDEFSRLVPSEKRFPSAAGGKGFAPLAEYVHSLGLKFGIHIMRGIPRQAVHKNALIKGTDKTARQIAKTSSICQWNTDMYGVDPAKEGAKEYYDSLFELYASWGVDFIKVDDICREMPHEETELVLLSESLKGCGREMILSLSPGPALLEKAELYKQTSNMWRITDDFWDNWDLLRNMFDRCELWQNHVAEGSYPDCDMLPLGKLGKGFGKQEWNTNFTKDEQITMMTLWCVFGSPLMIGAELTKLDGWTLDLLTRKDILKLVSSAYAGKQFEKNADYAIWSCMNQTTGEKFIAFFNFRDTEQEIKCDLKEVEQFADVKVVADSARELWSRQESAIHEGVLADTVPQHGARLFELS